MKVYKSQVKKHFSQRTTLGEFLMKLTPLTPGQLGDAANKGAVWIQRKSRGKTLRIRSLKESIDPEDTVQIFYDPKVLKIPEVSEIEAVFENDNYGVWIKPPGVVPQGSQSSDHASLLRCVEKIRGKEVFLVHRLDRETEGLMIVAYNSKAAALFSDLFQKNLIHKEYEAIILGELPEGHKQTITASLDDKEAITHIECLKTHKGQSLLRVRIETGRLHQIRRHLDFIGHPIMGDPKYGKGNKNKEGMKLRASVLAFQDPWEKIQRVFKLPDQLNL